MKTIYHSANSRGNADHGWLKSKHTFSFGHYYDPSRVNFGVLRVINDDFVEGGMGFGTHPHNNMEIISIPLSGDLAHKDSMGNGSIIRNGDIQVMSAGTGVTHSEMNPNADIPVKFLQIWVIPNKRNVEPRYQQITIADNAKPNDFQQILSPNPDDEGVWIHQDAWFSLAKFDKGIAKNYSLNKAGNGVYAFVIKGQANVAGIDLNERDGLGVWDTNNLDIVASSDAEILLMEVPMEA
ncbi:TPA: pirin family protein [Pasteurella multocida]|uniref:Pirin family protein n=1 Tax=Pasteurella multocida TaxID=747 RepID=A0A849CJ48_PASMD|nr:pirin family protein [Pasteurella multocida]AWW60391.1 pirin family protein [Pasteurellaceae bacterium 12591]AET16501.1 protein yhhW [Pasteurella multocida 36950]AFI46802.1 protein YhhW [Pasteurella multocida subsp. multocida str. 3480]AHE64998.1 protein yhhW [Pasteurella multocida subsp. multocida str. HB03]AIN48207.1 pirin family protein [Pasteurella multocida]